MSHTVVRRFKDKKHNGRIYNVGEKYPAQGHKASNARLEELSTEKNAYKQIYIEEVKDTENVNITDKSSEVEKVENPQIEKTEKDKTPDKDKE